MMAGRLIVAGATVVGTPTVGPTILTRAGSTTWTAIRGRGGGIVGAMGAGVVAVARTRVVGVSQEGHHFGHLREKGSFASGKG